LIKKKVKDFSSLVIKVILQKNQNPQLKKDKNPMKTK
jgi:hypothetical protein